MGLSQGHRMLSMAIGDHAWLRLVFTVKAWRLTKDLIIFYDEKLIPPYEFLKSILNNEEKLSPFFYYL